MQCTKCSKETSNPKFCSRSCSAAYANTRAPKRKLTRSCSRCDNVVLSYRHTKCRVHWEEYLESKKTAIRFSTIGAYRNRDSVKNKDATQINSHIRLFARYWHKHLKNLPCAKCGYDKHVELAHIRAVTDFDDNELLSEVNSEDNLIQLCPNCHWEFDNLPRDNFLFNCKPLSENLENVRS